MDNNDIQTDEIVFQAAATRADFIQAFEIVHDQYVASGLMDPHPSGLRITEYNLVPSTSVYVIKQGDQVLGAASLIPRSVFRLPAEALFDLHSLIRSEQHYVEFSGLAVRASSATKVTRLSTMFTLYLLQVAKVNHGFTHALATCHPRHAKYYRRYGFETVQGTAVRDYDFVKGSPAECIVLDFRILDSLIASAKAVGDPGNLFVQFEMRRGFNCGIQQGQRSLDKDSARVKARIKALSGAIDYCLTERDAIIFRPERERRCPLYH